MRKPFLFLLTLLVMTFSTQAQDDPMSILEEEQQTTEQNSVVGSTFKSTRIINLHSVETPPKGALQTVIAHRFGRINTGVYDWFGLDQAIIRLGFDYGFSDRLAAGLGRSSFTKSYDLYAKYKILRQATGAGTSPISLVLIGGASAFTLRTPMEITFSDRLTYFTQVLIAKKVTPALSLQLAPTYIHRNTTPLPEEQNGVFAIGAGGRLMISKRVSVNGEYIYNIPGQIDTRFRNSVSIGFDIETGGHVFQVHLTNSVGMIERQFISETTGNWFDGDVHLGFNLTRIFQIGSRQVAPEPGTW